MSQEALQLLAEFEALPPQEKLSFVKEIFRRLPPFDSGSLDDEDVALAGDAMAAMLEKEEDAAGAR
jgi:hypothetical protein